MRYRRLCSRCKKVGLGKPVTDKETNSKGTCFHYGKNGHWKRNCKVYLESLKKEKYGDASTSGIYVIEVNTNTAFNNQNWVLDTGCGSHICCDRYLKLKHLHASPSWETPSRPCSSFSSDHSCHNGNRFLWSLSLYQLLAFLIPPSCIWTKPSISHIV